MKKFKDFIISEGDVVDFSKFRKKDEPTPASSKPDVDTKSIKSKVQSIDTEAKSILAKDPKPSWVTPAISNQYRGTDVHPLEQLHQHMTASPSDLHDDPNIGKQRQEFARKIYSDNKDEIHSHLDRLIDKMSSLRDHHVSNASTPTEKVMISKQFDTATGHVGRFENLKNKFNKFG